MIRSRASNIRGFVALTVCWVLVTAAAVVSPLAPFADAQARQVFASVRTSPPVPEPGDDVSARVSISGCPPGAALVETFLTFSDGATQTSVRVALTAANSSLLFASTAVVSLPAALEGWYGVRVICGDFRPARAPMTNTMFVVGPRPTEQALLDTPTVAQNATLAYHGDGCHGARIEYSVSQISRNASPFLVTGSIPVQLDGTWSGAVGLPLGLKAGQARIAARCVHELPSGDKAYVYFPGDDEFTVTAAG